MKVAYISVFEPRNISSWSGCSYYLAKALEHKVDTIDFIGPLRQKKSIIYKLKRTMYRHCGNNYLDSISPDSLEFYSAQAMAKIETSRPDVILCLQALPLAYLKTNIPIVYYWDCTFEGNLEYPWFAQLATECVNHGHEMERRALRNCRIAVYSSNWAAKSAIETYGADPYKVRIAPLGANLECSRTAADIAKYAKLRSRKECQLLFIGVDWKRKGGDLAVSVAAELNKQGMSTVLKVVGCEPEMAHPLPSYVHSLGFLDKNNPSERVKIESLYLQSHFLVVPSVAESFGTVFSEASSFGVPSLSRAIGGITTAIKNGVNGYLFPATVGPEPYCDKIIELMSNFGEYERLAQSSYDEYIGRLNWSSTAEALLAIFNEVHERCAA